MRFCAIAAVLAGGVFGLAAAQAQNQQCRTAPVGTATANCASEAFVTQSRGTLTPQLFSAVAAGCGAGTEGSTTAITDSTTNSFGAVIAGGGPNHVLGYCNGSAWTVAGR